MAAGGEETICSGPATVTQPASQPLYGAAGGGGAGDRAPNKGPRGFYNHITEKAPTRAYSGLKVATTAFIFKNLLRHYANQPACPLRLLHPQPNFQFHIYLQRVNT